MKFVDHFQFQPIYFSLRDMQILEKQAMKAVEHFIL